MIAAYKGHQKLALDLLRIDFDRRSVLDVSALWQPVMAETRKTDEFAQLVTDLGLPAAWETSGDWGDYCKPKDDGGITCH
jgi:hypothetical protein